MKLKTIVAAFLLALISKSVSSQCTPPPVSCTNTDFSNAFINSSTPNTIEYDNIVSTFHSSMARQSDGRVLVWGEHMNGNTHVFTPKELKSTNFPGLTGTVLKFTGASANINTGQFIALTTDGLFYWGDEETILGFPWNYSGVKKLSVGLPTGVNPGDVKMLFGTTRYLVIVTCGGDVWSLYNGVSWKKIMIDSTTPLTGVVAARGADIKWFKKSAFMALKSDGTVWTWGELIYNGDGSGPSSSTYATKMTIPTGITPKMIGMTGGIRKVGSNNIAEMTYYLLATNGDLYALGGNSQKQLGIYNTTDTASWVRPLKSNSSTDYLTNVAWISPNEHDGSAGMPAINVLTTDGTLWSWGYNSFNMLGTGADDSIDPTKNIGGLTASDKLMAVETGGHTSIVIKQCSGKFGYVGHFINGSMASGSGVDGSTTGAFNFANTATLNVCGANSGVAFISSISAPVYAGSVIQLNYAPLGGTFSIVSGSATVTSTGQLTLTGTAANTVVVKYESNSPCANTNNQITINVQRSLSVGFGAVSAKIINNGLVIDWTTLNETNNSHFEIEASSDGINFTKIGEVISKAKEGNSSEINQYDFTKAAFSTASILGIGLMVIGGLALAIGVGARRKRIIYALIVLVSAATIYTGCAKNNDTTATNEGNNFFVRIAQVDKDGTKTYSKAVTVKR